MTTFADAALDRLGRLGEPTRRRELFEAFSALGLPRTEDEIWRYAPLAGFSLEAYAGEERRAPVTDPSLIPALVAGAVLVVRTVDGELVAPGMLPPGLSLRSGDVGECVDDVRFDDRYGADAFGLLNGALTPTPVVLEVAPGVEVGPVVVLHEFTARAGFPSLRVTLGAGSRLDLVECLLGGEEALVVPVGEYRVGADAELVLSTYQRLATTCWHVARTTVVLERDARVRQSVVGLGGSYNRSRNDARFIGPGAVNELRTTFLGTGTQVHDLRTHQMHEVGRTTSSLVSKGAVADHARSVYTGLIEIDKGAKRTDARQRNVNLLLAPTAHADTVPNLDIRENDVSCAHASSVGPLDEMQVWYLESRGIERATAERLLVQGFFNEMTDAMSPALARRVEADVATLLTAVVP